MPLLLSRSDMKRLLDMPTVIDTLEQGFRESGKPDDHIPERLALQIAYADAVSLFMPAFLSKTGVFGAKMVSVFPENTKHGLPVVTGYYLLCDAETGALLALMDATHLTAVRTAATSAVASRHLARPDVSTLGIFGAGVQARFHLEAIKTVLPLREAIVYNRTHTHALVFATEMERLHGFPVRVASTPDEALQADVLITCTRSATPLFDGRKVRPGTHINAVGVYTPDAQELDAHLIRRATVYVDTPEGALTEAGDLLVPIRQGLISKDHIRGGLAALLRGEILGRRSNEEITVFKSVGFALEDIVTAQMAYEKALTEKVGLSFDL
ncbi:MAG: ornithine cyclodeaminase family protein [candidate division Zixibacteria bacterium]|nr:ornithine cyclodeaminase family protein [candidate division Zixibacteria bacterium]